MEQEIQAKIQKLQLLEENLHALLAQKQQVQAQLMEVESAKGALDGKDSGYQIVGNIMVEQTAKDLNKDLDERMERSKVRLAALEKQEADVKKKAESIQKDVMESMKGDSK
ncbi:hypothetical protein GOV07_04280 [Candidatus Woesearchaeota archaeon]|nr:hypothetical protein [Candidatus Woesearchaeota archaeon]